MENQNIFSFLISRLERRYNIISSRGVLPLEENLPKNNLLKDSLELPRYNCKDRVKCRDFDIDKVNFINFGSKKAKIIPVDNITKKEVSYCDIV